MAAEGRFCLCPESCEPSSVCQQGFSSHDGSPVDTIPGSRPNGVPSYPLINLIPINLRDCALLCHLCLFCQGAKTGPGPRANVTGMNQFLIYVIGANDFSSIDNRQTGERLFVIISFRRAHDCTQAADVSVFL